MADPELGNAGLIRKELHKADPDAENADEGLKQLTTGKKCISLQQPRSPGFPHRLPDHQ
jgi:hypothetical protein